MGTLANEINTSKTRNYGTQISKSMASRNNYSFFNKNFLEQISTSTVLMYVSLT